MLLFFLWAWLATVFVFGFITWEHMRLIRRQGVQIQTLRDLVEGQAEDIQTLFNALSDVRR